jgi:hypothetical protein
VCGRVRVCVLTASVQNVLAFDEAIYDVRLGGVTCERARVAHTRARVADVSHHNTAVIGARDACRQANDSTA